MRVALHDADVDALEQPVQLLHRQRRHGSNRLDLSAVHDARTGNFILTSALDNLVKGASGQAVQIMNLWLGLPETAGLT